MDGDRLNALKAEREGELRQEQVMDYEVKMKKAAKEIMKCERGMRGR